MTGRAPSAAPALTSFGKPRPLWLDDAYGDDFRPTPPLVGEVTADVAIVGGGYVGLWTALELKHRAPDIRVVVLERRICGAGASGRNSGIVMSWWSKVRSLERTVGTDEAIRLAEASDDAVEALARFCAERCPEAHFRKAGWLWVATAPAHVGAWEKTVRRCAELGRPRFTSLAGGEVTALTGSPVHLGGVFEAHAATVHPGHLVKALRQRALDVDVRIFENTPVRAIARDRPVVLSCVGGRVVAKKAVLATNAWSAGIPGLRRKILAVASDLVATAPIPERLDGLGWRGGQAVIEARHRIRVYRTTADGRITFGRGGGGLAFAGFVGPRFEASPAHAETTARHLRRAFPMLGDVPISHSWSAAVDLSPSGLPMFGRLGAQRNVAYGIGWSGFGVAPSLVGARILASLVLDSDDEWASSRLVERARERFPPEPIRFLGGQVVRAAVTAMERAEDRGHAPPRWAEALSVLAPEG